VARSRAHSSGTGFGPGDIVVFDRSAVSPAETTATEIVCVAPPHAEGVVDLYVARPIRAGSLVSQSNRILVHLRGERQRAQVDVL
jgi:hypothetical protein